MRLRERGPALDDRVDAEAPLPAAWPDDDDRWLGLRVRAMR